jgi:hypothetical protein
MTIHSDMQIADKSDRGTEHSHDSTKVPNANEHDLMKALMREHLIAMISFLRCMLARRGNEVDDSWKAKALLPSITSIDSAVAKHSLLTPDGAATGLFLVEHRALVKHEKGVQGE